jgi:hypothetical protein
VNVKRREVGIERTRERERERGGKRVTGEQMMGRLIESELKRGRLNKKKDFLRAM